MSRLAITLMLNLLLQLRNGFYVASIFFVLIWLALLAQLPRDGMLDIGYVVPAFLVLNTVVICFYFIAGLVLLEKAEGTLSGLVVTPLRDGEYLAAKALTLTALAVAEGLLIVLPIYGAAFNPLPLLLGIVLLGCFYTFVGFISIARVDSINEYMIPSGLIVAALLLPLLDYFGLLDSPIFYLHPVQPSLILMRAAFAPIALPELAYGFLGSILWLTIAYLLARRAFYRFVIRTAGS